MGTPKVPQDVKLVCAITFSNRAHLDEIRSQLESLFGEIELTSAIYDFIYTEYYEAEMGSSLLKQFVAFRELVPPHSLAAIKLLTNHLESHYTEGGKRRLNLDPGYISAAKLVLATTKNYDHRLYLNKGIYGDIQLKIRDKRFLTNEWTYPDYAAAHSIQFFEQVRKVYLKQLRERNERNKL
ncbi:DUF4416 family protein [candidate division KSB1 bacterium]|nr:DUF4416 family protein [candidate division KSB1 bacterium]